MAPCPGLRLLNCCCRCCFAAAARPAVALLCCIAAGYCCCRAFLCCFSALAAASTTNPAVPKTKRKTATPPTHARPPAPLLSSRRDARRSCSSHRAATDAAPAPPTLRRAARRLLLLPRRCPAGAPSSRGPGRSHPSSSADGPSPLPRRGSPGASPLRVAASARALHRCLAAGRREPRRGSPGAPRRGSPPPPAPFNADWSPGASQPRESRPAAGRRLLPPLQRCLAPAEPREAAAGRPRASQTPEPPRRGLSPPPSRHQAATLPPPRRHAATPVQNIATHQYLQHLRWNELWSSETDGCTAVNKCSEEFCQMPQHAYHIIGTRKFREVNTVGDRAAKSFKQRMCSAQRQRQRLHGHDGQATTRSRDRWW
ncbi:translation initiation factor IF-2 [Triticum aestivum]|uniref:translation initiation factor IF-2 n=1 Tax=Triticum aestivum TaxID=4565 RepID=UPI001D019AA1|nr:translation initiation factor IF-2-like [Triticum aestivum]